jgi:hemerythrin-like domain-containing protein
MSAYMFEWFSLDNSFLASRDAGSDAIGLLIQNHDLLKDLFEQFENATNPSLKKKIAAQALSELKVHAALEEDIFYPAVRKALGREIMNKADEEHHVAKLLIAELENLKGRGDHYDAKFTVLAECVRHHIQEEESEMLPKARALDLDFALLGQQMQRRKQQLLTEGVGSKATRPKPRNVKKRSDKTS